jgi:chemotaxis family two-component system sensor kinase Cph1
LHRIASRLRPGDGVPLRPDGHGKIIAEARDPRLESLLGHHYPASDIPQRARELYLRNRVRVLVDVHYEASAAGAALRPAGQQPLDMSLCALRSMSPLHLQYLRNMGVTGTWWRRWCARASSGA